MLTEIEIGQGDEPSIIVKLDNANDNYHIKPKDLAIILNNYLGGYYIGQFEDEIVDYITRIRKEEDVARLINKLDKYENKPDVKCIVKPNGAVQFTRPIRMHKKAFTISEEVVENYWS